MPWFAEPDDGGAEADRAARVARPSFSPRILESKFQRLSELAEPSGGLERLVQALRAKQALCAKVLGPGGFDAADRDGQSAVIHTMFTARRKFARPFLSLDDRARRGLLQPLLRGPAPAHRRLRQFVEGAPTGEDRKVRRAAWDFAAECLHFTDPERYPLMTRWVWDAAVGTGALREFVAGSDIMASVPLGDEIGSFDASRRWFVEQLERLGCYRDVPFVVDLVLAQAYGDYMQAMSMNVGLVSGEPGGKADPLEFSKKLVGIDGRRRGARRRTH